MLDYNYICLWSLDSLPINIATDIHLAGAYLLTAEVCHTLPSSPEAVPSADSTWTKLRIMIHYTISLTGITTSTHVRMPCTSLLEEGVSRP